MVAFTNFLKKQRQGHCIPLCNKFQMLGKLESDRSDDDDMEAPRYVFDDNENGRWIKEEAVVDSAVECVTSRKRVPHLKVEETPESRRGETWTCAGGKKGRQSNNQLDKRIRCFEEKCCPARLSVSTGCKKRCMM